MHEVTETSMVMQSQQKLGEDVRWSGIENIGVNIVDDFCSVENEELK